MDDKDEEEEQLSESDQGYARKSKRIKNNNIKEKKDNKTKNEKTRVYREMPLRSSRRLETNNKPNYYEQNEYLSGETSESE
jgi:hypothetical protein